MYSLQDLTQSEDIWEECFSQPVIGIVRTSTLSWILHTFHGAEVFFKLDRLIIMLT